MTGLEVSKVTSRMMSPLGTMLMISMSELLAPALLGGGGLGVNIVSLG